MAGSSPPISMPIEIVVLSPPGITSPSRSVMSRGVLTSLTAAPRSRRARSCASNPPWIARTPRRSSGTAVLQQRVGGGQLGNLEARHGLTETDRGRCHPLRVVEVRGRLDDRLGAPLGIRALEDARADEVALGAELHHQRRVGRRSDAAGTEERYG